MFYNSFLRYMSYIGSVEGLCLIKPRINLRYSTVYALSSGKGKCAVAIIRVTGRDARESILKMTKPRKIPTPRIAALRQILHPVSDELLDKGLVVWFPSPKSFTGEDSVEFHTHGGPAVISAILQALGSLPNFVPAQPGDFTKRAFYNNKMDLTRVEGLGDLICAETEAQRKQAMRQMNGQLAEYYSNWRNLTLRSRANLEAYIDFSEDENINPDVLLDVKSSLESLICEMKKHLMDSKRGEKLKSGLNFVILGRPNVGKSSFLNFFVQRPAAIVSPVAGTTRDIVEISLDFDGYPLNVSDTAGLRTTDDFVEKEGVKRALKKISDADIALIVVEASEILSKAKSNSNFDFENFLLSYFFEVGIFECNDCIKNKNLYEWITKSQYVVLVNKIDLVTSQKDIELLNHIINKETAYLASVTTREGIGNILSHLKSLCSNLCSSGGSAESPYLTSTRHRTHVENCLGHLQLIIPNDRESQNGLLHREETLLFAAQHLQLAANQLGQITGHITAEDILDTIFSSFCIGK